MRLMLLQMSFTALACAVMLASQKLIASPMVSSPYVWHIYCIEGSISVCQNEFCCLGEGLMGEIKNGEIGLCEGTARG